VERRTAVVVLPQVGRCTLSAACDRTRTVRIHSSTASVRPKPSRSRCRRSWSTQLKADDRSSKQRRVTCRLSVCQTKHVTTQFRSNDSFGKLTGSVAADHSRPDIRLTEWPQLAQRTTVNVYKIQVDRFGQLQHPSSLVGQEYSPVAKSNFLAEPGNFMQSLFFD